MTIVILCIDRDNDVGRKTPYKGPVIGWDKNLEAAKSLGLKDPTDTDVNALFGALKIAKEIKAEIVTLTGDKHVGVISDRQIANQLDLMMKKLKPDSVIFVSDGLDDEQVIPIIQSRVKIDSVHRVVVRQSKELEKAYFKLANFMGEVTSDPQLARLLFGLPGLVFLLLALWGAQALSLIIGVVGAYLLIKGFGLEETLFDKAEEFVKSLSVERVSTLLYFICIVSWGLGFVESWQDLSNTHLSTLDAESAMNTLAFFMINSNSIYFFMIGFAAILFAKIGDDWKLKNFIGVKKYLVVGGFAVVVKNVLDAMAQYIVVEEFGVTDFLLAGTIVLVSLLAWIKLVEYIFKPEIDLILHIIDEYTGLTVVNEKGEDLGKVKRVVVENLEVKEIVTKRKIYGRKDILSFGEKITVKI